MLLALAAVLSGRGCDCQGTAQSIPCASDSHCPPPLVCRERVCQAGAPLAPPDVCRAAPESEGCACTPGRTVSCYEGPEGTAGVGICKAGLRECRDGWWSACQGQVLPEPELCDGLDNNCDGHVDEVGMNPCGTCSRGCRGVDVTGSGFDLSGPGTSGVVLDEDGSVTLGGETVSAPYLWIANDGEETVSKVDSATGREVGRYVAAPPQPVSVRPSRTTVDLLGDAYVANRAFDGQGSVTKFAGQPGRCVDRNGNGWIDTSMDVDGDGFIPRSDVLAWGSDECVLWNVLVGPHNAVPRAIAIDAGDADSPEGYVWVGTYYRGGGKGAGMAYKLRPRDGALMGEPIALPPDFNPYGAAVDCRGILWFQQSGTVGDLAAVDTRQHKLLVGPRALDGRIRRPAGPANCKGAYGMTVDGEGRVWQAGNACNDAWRYTPGRDDPTSGTWERVELSGLPGRPIGVAVDLEGRVWVSGMRSSAEGGGAVAAIDGTVTPPRLLSIVPLVDAFGAIAGNPKGVGVDPYARIWLITNENSCLTPDGQPTGCAVRYDPMTRAVDLHAVGDRPYTYSDFLGFVARNFTARVGFFSTVVSLCKPVERWGQLTLQAETPPGSRIRVRVRAAESLVALAAAPWSSWRRWLGAPLDLEEMVREMGGRGDLLEVGFELGYDPMTAETGEGLCPVPGAPPRLSSMTVYVECPLNVE